MSIRVRLERQGNRGGEHSVAKELEVIADGEFFEVEDRGLWANALDKEEARALYEDFHVAAAGNPIFQVVTANLNPFSETKVDTKNPDRGPLLLIAGEDDHTVPVKPIEQSYAIQSKNIGVTEFAVLPHRGHSLTIDHGWKEVADTAIAFIERFTPGAPRPDIAD